MSASSAPLNVAIVVNNLDIGGLENVALDLLRELDSDEFRMHLVCLDGEGARFDSVALPPERCLVLHKGEQTNLLVGKADLSRFLPLQRFFSHHSIRVAHCHNLAPLLYGGVAAQLVRGARVVYSEHNQIYRADDFAKKKFRLYVELADEVVAVSHALRETLVDELHIRPPVSVIHNGIDGQRFQHVDGNAIREELSIALDAFVVGTAVVHSKQKALHHMLEAARIVVDADPSVRFVLAGDGPSREALLQQCKDLELDEHVQFPGYRTDVPELISAFDVYALSSLWEGLPLALLEALSIGRPIVATTVGGNPEVVRDGENGFLVPPNEPAMLADRILRLRRDPALVATIRAANRKRFQAEFSLQCMIDAHANLYRRHS